MAFPEEGTQRGLSVAPSRFLSCLPLTFRIRRKFWIALGLFNGTAALVHALSNRALADWLRWTEPATEAVGRVVVGIDQVAEVMLKYGFAERIPLVKNIIAFNWIIAAAFLAVGFFTMSLEFHTNGGAIGREVTLRVWQRGRGVGEVMAYYVLLAATGIFLVYTKFGVGGAIPLYYVDAQFLMIAVFFACTADFLWGLLALGLSLLQKDGSK